MINRDVLSPDLELMITLNVTLTSTERLEIVYDLFEYNVTYNASYDLTTVQMVINTTSSIIGMR